MVVSCRSRSAIVGGVHPEASPAHAHPPEGIALSLGLPAPRAALPRRGLDSVQGSAPDSDPRTYGPTGVLPRNSSATRRLLWRRPTAGRPLDSNPSTTPGHCASCPGRRPVPRRPVHTLGWPVQRFGSSEEMIEVPSSGELHLAGFPAYEHDLPGRGRHTMRRGDLRLSVRAPPRGVSDFASASGAAHAGCYPVACVI
jgi:hypothetical protein